MYNNHAMSPERVSVSDTLREVDDFFMKISPVHDTLRNLAARCAEENIRYAIIGGMALAIHGLVRPTQDVDVLMTTEGLNRFQKHLVGRGYVPVFPGAGKHFRDTFTGVKVEVVTTGEYPGDHKPKPVAFPAPEDASVEVDGIRVAKLETIIELKLASGLSAEHRTLRDLGDVQMLIETLDLPADLENRLDSSVRAEYLRLWKLVQKAREESTES